MAERKKGFSFSPQKLKAPTFTGRAGSGLETKQVQSQAAVEATPPGSFITQIKNPLSGTTIQTPASIDMDVQTHVRKKAAEDALKVKSILPLIDDLEQTYREAYADRISEGGLSGGVGAAQEYGMGVILRKNQALRTLVGKLKQYRPAIVRAAGDSGNFSVVEQQAAGEGLPKLAPNLNIGNLFLPDDPVQGLARIQGLRDLYKRKFEEQVRVSETGDFIGTGYEENMNKMKSQKEEDPLGLFS